eukprot:CAMPEP_0171311178 /NCGR_PEP_ID=MMETSP0816-20121228/21417_1 /TAXON_ID=420281 /ORGANISM="Proboscia inermis, Strain CCAP1064/1" /LENGTH=151 /DNA_ID=CAMNT_0011795787 /DNA_START=119 /DNA_END=574 /DNA_ORIENTATION=+
MNVVVILRGLSFISRSTLIQNARDIDDMALPSTTSSSMNVGIPRDPETAGLEHQHISSHPVKKTIGIIRVGTMSDVDHHAAKKEHQELMSMMEEESKSEFTDGNEHQHEQAMEALLQDLLKTEHNLTEEIIVYEKNRPDANKMTNSTSSNY